ncbi:MAG: YceI family protein [Bernardetiaceae bacterium]|nr:YceI family protein [Bernardetiaceae bacterium]
MKLFKLSLALIVSLFFMVSCGGGESNESANAGDEPSADEILDEIDGLEDGTSDATTLPDGQMAINTETSVIKWMGDKVVGDGHDGTIQIKEGSLTVEGGNLVAGNFVIDMTSIKNMDIEDQEQNAKLVGHLSSDDFFNVEKYPTAKFTVTSVEAHDGSEVKGSNTEGATHKITGDLTIRDKTAPVTFLANVSGGDVITAKGNVTIDRTQWDVKYGNEGIADLAKDKMIKNDIVLDIEITAAPAM